MANIEMLEPVSKRSLGSLLKRRQVKRDISNALAYIPLVIWAILSLMPMYWMVTISLMNVVTLLRMPPKLFPDPFTTLNYARLLGGSMLLRWELNSSIIAVTNTLISLTVSSFYGYIFAKKQFPGKRALFWILICTLMVPFHVVAIPIFLMFRQFQMINSYWGLIIPGIFSAYGVFLMRQVIKTLPTELMEAAKIDGASEFQIYTKIILPLSKPGLAVLGIFSFVGNWNDFFWPLILLNDSKMYTLPVGLPTLQGQWTDYGLLMAGATLAALPTIAIFLLFQRYFLQGITVGAIKG